MQLIDSFKLMIKGRKNSNYTNFTRIVLLLTLVSFIMLSVFSQHTCCDEDFIQQSIQNNVQPDLKLQPLSVKNENDICLACLWQNIVNSTGQIVYIPTALFSPVQYVLVLKENLYNSTLNASKADRAPPLV